MNIYTDSPQRILDCSGNADTVMILVQGARKLTHDDKRHMYSLTGIGILSGIDFFV